MRIFMLKMKNCLTKLSISNLLTRIE